MNQNYKAVIFDLDGTMLNSLADLAASVNRVLSKHNHPTHEIKAYRYFIGDGAKMLINRALPEDQRNEKVIDKCLKAFKIDYQQNWKNESALYPGIENLLNTLSSYGIRLAVLSNKPHAFTVQCVEHFLSKWTFDIILGQQADLPRKPDPAGALAIARHMQLDPSLFCYVGDSAVDMKTALASGMYPIGVLWGYRHSDELKAAGAAVLVSEPSDILNHCMDLLNM